MSTLLRLKPSLVLESNVFHSTGISENPKTADKMLWLDMEKIRKSRHVFLPENHLKVLSYF